MLLRINPSHRMKHGLAVGAAAAHRQQLGADFPPRQFNAFSQVPSLRSLEGFKPAGCVTKLYFIAGGGRPVAAARGDLPRNGESGAKTLRTMETHDGTTLSDPP